MPTLHGRLARLTRGWPRRARRIVAAVLVLNVALGMAFSVIGLRRQAGDRAMALVELSQQMAAANAVRADVWTSVAAGAPTAALVHDDLGPIARWTSVHPGHGTARGTGAAFVISVRAVRAALAAGDVAQARVDAQLVDHRLTALLDRMRTMSATQRRQSAQGNTAADIETIVLMMFAAGMGLLLFRRTVAARINGDLRAANERARAEAKFGALVRHSSDLISIVDVDFTVMFQTDSLRAVLGYETGDLAGTTMLDLVHRDDRVRMVAAHDALLDGSDVVSTTVRMRGADGQWRHVESVHHDMRGEQAVARIVIASRDISERVALEARLRHSAFHDDLTGLANRALFSDRVTHALSRRTFGAAPAVVFLDLDDFKSVNDTLGHHVGDQLLVIVAERLVGIFRDSDTVARFGGDEFAVLVEDLDDDACQVLLARVEETLRRPVVLETRQLSVRASIGVARATPGQDSESLLANADLAMYAAKAAGKGTVLTFTPDMADTAVARLQLKTELHDALRSGQIRAHFQPTVRLDTGRISGFEALARWEHPQRGTVAPYEFIPLAEQTGQIVGIGREVLRQACHALAGWHHRHPGLGHLTVAVNVSARELDEPDLLGAVSAALADSGLAARSLTLEVTESLLMTDPEQATRQLMALRELGVRVAIDDFGTGYSSLSYLEQLPADIVKIDKAFVDRLEEGQANVIVETITKLCATLGKTTVAEGIEHSSQADLLRGVGCDIGQGYLFSRPVPADSIDALLTEQDVPTLALAPPPPADADPDPVISVA